MRKNEMVKASRAPTAQQDYPFGASQRVAGGTGLTRPEQAGRIGAPGRALMASLAHKVGVRSLPGRVQEDIA